MNKYFLFILSLIVVLGIGVIIGLSLDFPTEEKTISFSQKEKLDSLKPLERDLGVYIKELYNRNKKGFSLELELLPFDMETYRPEGFTVSSVKEGKTINIYVSGGPSPDNSLSIEHPRWSMEIPDSNETYALNFYSSEDRDTYNLTINERFIEIKPTGRTKFSGLKVHERLLRVPENSMWVEFQYTKGHRDRFEADRKALEENMEKIGAEKFEPEKGIYAYVSIWPYTFLEEGDPKRTLENGYVAGSLSRDVWYFLYDGDTETLEKTLKNSVPTRCIKENKTPVCNYAGLSTWSGFMTSNNFPQ